MMTTMAALLGGLPLALGTGMGSELRKPLGITIVGGLIVSQALTLFTTPVVYLYFDRLAQRLSRRRARIWQRTDRAHGLGGLGDGPCISPLHSSAARSPPRCSAWRCCSAAPWAMSLLPGARRCPRSSFPPSTSGADLPGASPETAASAVATPLERQFGRIAGVTEMTSSSTLGGRNITLQFDLNRNIDGAARDVQAAINAARSQLPANLPQNPRFCKVQPGRRADHDPGAHLRPVEPSRRSTTRPTPSCSRRSRRCHGVGQSLRRRQRQPAVRVEPIPCSSAPTASAWSRCGPRSARSTRTWPPATSATTSTASATSTPTISSFKARNYAPLVVGYNPTTGAAVRLEDVASVIDSTSNLYTSGLANGKPRRPDHHLQDPRRERHRYRRPRQGRAALARGLHSAAHPDQHCDGPHHHHSRRVHDVEITLLISIVLVILVVFLFLRDVWATIIPSVAVPLSLVGTFGVMYLLGYTMDNLSLMALTISTGFVVDDAIVVIENITRYLEQGMTPFEAAMKGSQEIGFTVLSMSTSLIAVFIPILLMGGIVGRLFREFAVTLSVAIAVSLVVSLTTTPMMCAKFLRQHNPSERSRALPLRRARSSTGCWPATTAACAGCSATRTWCCSSPSAPWR